MGLPKAALLAIIVVIAGFGVAVFIGLGFLGGDTDRDGRVAVPGAAALELPAGEVDLFYAEDVNLGDSEELSPPRDLELRVVDPAGEPLAIRRRSGQQVGGGGGTATLIGSIDVPAAGAYEISTRSTEAASRAVPEITLGESPFDQVGERAGDVADVIIGPLGIAALVLLILAGAVALIRGRSSERGPTLPPGYGG